MKHVTDTLWISAQPNRDDIEQARQAGVVRIINNRPDGEEVGQPTSADTADLAKALGMDYVHIPVRSGQISQSDVDAFHKALAEAPGPVLAHCRSGTRSLTLYTIGAAQAGRLTSEGIDALAARTGLDLSGAKAWLNNQ